jgi:hypothetical protein
MGKVSEKGTETRAKAKEKAAKVCQAKQNTQAKVEANQGWQKCVSGCVTAAKWESRELCLVCGTSWTYKGPDDGAWKVWGGQKLQTADQKDTNKNNKNKAPAGEENGQTTGNTNASGKGKGNSGEMSWAEAAKKAL